MVKQRYKEQTMKELLTANYSKYYLAEQRDSHSISYSYVKSSTMGDVALLNAQENRRKVIDNFFSPLNKVLSGRPVFSVTMDKVVVSFPYYREPLDVIRLDGDHKGAQREDLDYEERYLNPNTINNLGHVLSKVFGRPVELRVIKLKYPYLDRTILAKYCRMMQKTVPFHVFMKWAFSNIPVVSDQLSKEDLEANRPVYKNYPLSSQILGIKMQLSGRLESEVPRPKQKPVKGFIGIFKSTPGSFVDYGSCTRHNSNGSFTVKVWINQKLINKDRSNLNRL